MMPGDEKTTLSRPVEPVTVAIIGTGDGGKLPTGTEAVTPGQHAPNIVVQVVGPLLAITIRFVNAYLTAISGLILAGMATQIIPARDFVDLVWKCAGLSVAGAGLEQIKDLITVFGGLEKKFPLATGSV